MQVLNISVIPLSISASFQPIVDTTCLQTLDVLTHTTIKLSKDTLHVLLEPSQRLPEVMVEIVKPPSLGVLKHAETNESLPLAFSYTHFIEEQIAYVVSDGKMQQFLDTFDVRLSIGHGRSNVVTITLCINPLPYPMLTHLGTLSVYVTGQRMFSQDFLKATQTRLLESSPGDLVFHLVSTPTRGLILNHNMADSISSLHSFTQEEVNNGDVFYVNKRNENINMTDRFQFRLANKYYQSDNVYTALIMLKENKLMAVNTGFSVIEGGNHTITSQDLLVHAPDGYTLEDVYIIDFPNDGDLFLQRPGPAPIVKNSIFYTFHDIQNGYLTYNHSDSEIIMDMMTALVIAKKENSDLLDLPVLVNITIIPVNDRPPELVYNRKLTVIEGSSKPVTTRNLRFTDRDYGYDDDNIIYLLMYPLFQGKLCLNDICSNKNGFSWNQGDMHGGLIYKHSGDTSKDFLLFSVYDGDPNNGGLKSLESGLFEIILTSVDPDRVGKTPVTVRENSVALLTSDNIGFTSQGTVEKSEYNYTIIEYPKRGYLVWTATQMMLNSFTQEDVDVGYSLMYIHDGSNYETDSFTFRLDVRSFVDEYTVDINITPVDDDAPELIIQEKIFVDFMKSIHLNRSQLLIQDTDTLNADLLVYSISTTVEYGILEKRDNVNSQEYTLTQSFTQKDINDENVRYTHTTPHTEDNDFLDSFTFTISDSTQVKGSFESSIYILPDKVPVTVLGASVCEGGTVTLSSESIVIRHPYFAGTNGKVSIPEPVKLGLLKIDGVTCTHCDFNTRDLAMGKIQYTHGGGEDKQDIFRFFINWPGLLRTDYRNYTITILPVNDQSPYVVTSSRIIVWATEIITLTPAHLLTQDNDSPPEEIVYQFNLTPEQEPEGHFSFVGKPEKKQNTFTQDDINNGLITYVDTRDYEGFTRQLQYTVTDGNFTVNGEFNVTTRVVTLTNVYDGRASVHVEMGESVQLSDKQFTHVTNNQAINDSMISYTIVENGFTYGYIVNGEGYKITSFTQAELNSGSLRYTHTGEDIWEPIDFAIFTVSAPLVIHKKNVTLFIDVNIINQSSPLAVNSLLTVNEGGVVCLDHNSLDGRNVRYTSWKANPGNFSLEDVVLSYVVTTPPSFGQFLVNDSLVSTFYHSDVTMGVVCYHNNGSENVKDTIHFDAVVNSPYNELKRVSDVVNVHVVLTNDEKPRLRTGNLHLTVINGFWTPITSHHLASTDEDNLPSEITYRVDLNSDDSFRLGESTNVLEFTQADIDNGELMFISHKTGNTSFAFTIHDRDFQVGPIIFHVTVRQHVLEFLVNDSKLMFSQTESEAIFTTAILNTSTNGNRDFTQYSIVSSPSHGEIIVNGESSKTFTQSDVDNGKVCYKLTDQYSARDRMQVEVSNMNANNITVMVDIVVVPNGVMNEPVNALSPQLYVKLPTNLIVLDELSFYRHIYIDIFQSATSRGSLYVKYIGTAYTQVTSFEYRDLKNGYIYFKWNPSSELTVGMTHTETLSGIVRVEGLAPGEFTVSLNLQVPPEAIVSVPTISEPRQTPEPTNVGVTDPTSSSSEKSGFDLALYVPMLGLILVVILAVMVVIGFCCSQSRHIKHKLYHKSSMVNFNRTSPTQRPHRQSPTHPPHSPPLTGVFEHEYSDSESSTPDVMMTHGYTQHPMTTISASHTYLPHSQCSYDPTPPGYHTGQIGLSPTLIRHQESPVISTTASYMSGSMYGNGIVPLTRNELRSSSPVRKVAGSRRNSRPYASMIIPGKGKNSPTRNKDYSSPMHAMQLKDNASSTGYDTSSMTQDSLRLPSRTTPAPVNLDSLISQENVTDLYRKTHPVLNPSQHWV